MNQNNQSLQPKEMLLQNKYKQSNKWMIALIIIGFVAFNLLGYIIGKNSIAKVSIATPQSTPKPSSFPEILKCHFNSKWFGFSYDYSITKTSHGDICYSEDRDYELTDYSWPNAPYGVFFYPRNNLSGKEWWRKHITDEAGYLSENKYVFDFFQTKNGIDAMTVSIDSNKLNPKTDHVGSGPFKGSDYYFGKKWVIRKKTTTTGGPCGSCDQFYNTLKLIPINVD